MRMIIIPIIALLFGCACRDAEPRIEPSILNESGYPKLEPGVWNDFPYSQVR